MSSQENIILSIDDACISYGGKLAVRNVSLPIYEKKITAIIGPSGCGKSTLLRSINRMNDFVEGVTLEGKLSFKLINWCRILLYFLAEVPPSSYRSTITSFSI
jgi:ABC-type phosphate transport system ATPase subunit